MKYKLLNKAQILISIDRLTRFKNPKEKYLRVFDDIILANMINPIYKKADLEKLTSKELTELAENILNDSIKEVIGSSTDLSINKILKEYENSIFNCDDDVNILLDNKIDFYSASKLIQSNDVVNLRWLKSLTSNCNNLKENRHNNCLKFPIEKVILVEGITEEILLPVFAKMLGYDFYKEGIQLIPAGGKNQVVKLYYKLADELKLPIFLLLDNDAKENINQINPKLRKIDKIHLISCGEFEDLLPKSLIVKAINNDLSNFGSVSEADLDDSIPETKNLELIFKQKGLHEFKKAEFAKLVKDNLNDKNDLSEEIKLIIEEIKNF